MGAEFGSEARVRTSLKFRPRKLGVEESGILKTLLPCAVASLPYAVVPAESLSDLLGIVQPRKKFF